MVTISGRVVDEDGNPIEGAQVNASGQEDSGSATTSPLSSEDGGGYYQITGLEGGSYTVSASHPDYQSGPPRQVTADAEGVNISLWRQGEFISGHVRDDNGQPLEAAYVMAAADWAPDAPPPRSAWSDAEGYFQVSEVESDVEYGMSARKEGYISRDDEVQYARAGDEDVELILHQRTSEDPPEQPFKDSFDPSNPAEHPYDPVQQAMLESKGVTIPPKPAPPAIPAPAAGGGMPAARLGDTTAHGGTVGPPVSGMTVLIGNKPAATLGDNHVCPNVGPLPHVGGPILKGSATVLICNKPAARVGDQATCTGPPDVIAMGDFTTLIG